MKQCPDCGATLARRADESPGRFLSRRFCSRTCAASYGSEVARQKALAQPIGSGKTIERNGYLMVWIRGRIPSPSQTRALGRYVYVHRLVMESHLGRPLDRGEIVHHINEDKHDNRPENLELKPSQSVHMREHWEKWKADGSQRISASLVAW